MIKPLRKRHLQIWILLAVLLPVGIIFAWLVIPNQPSVKLLQEQHPVLLPITLQTRSLVNYDVTIRTNQEKTKWQLEWKNKTILVVPSAAIYATSSTATESSLPKDAELVGRIEARGDYAFDLPTDSSGKYKLNLIVYDFIHEKIIETIPF